MRKSVARKSRTWPAWATRSEADVFAQLRIDAEWLTACLRHGSDLKSIDLPMEADLVGVNVRKLRNLIRAARDEAELLRFRVSEAQTARDREAK